MKHDIKDISLAAEGRIRIEWSGEQMSVLKLIRTRFAQEKPLSGVRIAACLHITAETANLALTLKDGGAEIALCASNPLSTQDSVAAALVDSGIPVYAIRGEDEPTYYRHILAALEHNPQITMDDGADLVSILHQKYTEVTKQVLGGTEETTTGVIRLKNMSRQRKLNYAIIAVNDAQTKRFFDNRYGTGQSTVDGITRATNILWAGKKVVICGYGWCGRGIARRVQGMGAQVIITEVTPIPALEAAMDGYQVMPLLEAARIGDVFITATGDTSVIDREHFLEMKDGAIVANSGHFNVEINIPALETLAIRKRQLRPAITEYTLGEGRRVYLLAEGRLVNLAAAEGHPASVMDMSFANQAFSVEYLYRLGKRLEPGVYPVPEEMDWEVGRLKLKTMNITIDSLTEQQRKYLESWQEGT